MRRAAPGLLSVGVALAGMIYFAVTDSFSESDMGLDVWAYAIVGLGSIAFGVMGHIIASQAPTLPIGWLFLASATIGGLSLILFATNGLEPLGNALSFCMVIGALAVLTCFPGGHPDDRRWMAVLGLLALFALLMVSDALLDSTALDADLFANIAFIGTIVVGMTVLIRLVLMYRRGPTEVRRQLKYLLLVLILGAILLLSSIWHGFGNLNLNNVAGILMTVGAPIAIGSAVLKYRLYDIDRIVSRTLGYTLVVGVLGLVYAVGAVWLPAQLIGDEVPPMFVAGSTLLVVVLFNPVRRRLVGWVDRRFYRSRYDAVQVADRFSDRLRDQVDMEELAIDWAGVVTETMQPSSVAVWIRR